MKKVIVLIPLLILGACSSSNDDRINGLTESEARARWNDDAIVSQEERDQACVAMDILDREFILQQMIEENNVNKAQAQVMYKIVKESC